MPLPQAVQAQNHGHYHKLWRLFLANRDPLATPQSHAEPLPHSGAGEPHHEEGDECLLREEFHERVWALLARYHSLLGHGFQAALNEQSFQVRAERREESVMWYSECTLCCLCKRLTD